MPTISMFFGILIRMNWKDMGQHKVPHFHAFYGEYEAVFGLDGEIITGNFPRKQFAFVKGNPDLLSVRDEVQGARSAGTETYIEIC